MRNCTCNALQPQPRSAASPPSPRPQPSASSPPSPQPPLEQLRLFENVVEYYLANTAKRYAPRTLLELQRVLGIFTADFGQRPVAGTKPAELVFWLNRHPEWASDWTIKRVLGSVQRPLNWAARMQLIERNPFMGLGHQQGERRRPMPCP